MGAIIHCQGSIHEVAGRSKRLSRRVQRREVGRESEQVVARDAYIRQDVRPGQRHRGAKGCQVRCRIYGCELCVLPVRGPGHGDGRGNIVEELGGVIVFAEICQARGIGGEWGEMCAVKSAGEVGANATTKGGSGIDGDEEEVCVHGYCVWRGQRE